MIRRNLALFALLSFAIRPGTNEALLSVENSVLMPDWLSVIIIFGRIIGITRSKIILRLTFVAFDQIKVVHLFEDFILH
jgi:hypothetical protein